MRPTAVFTCHNHISMPTGTHPCAHVAAYSMQHHPVPRRAALLACIWILGCVLVCPRCASPGSKFSVFVLLVHVAMTRKVVVGEKKQKNLFFVIILLENVLRVHLLCAYVYYKFVRDLLRSPVFHSRLVVVVIVYEPHQNTSSAHLTVSLSTLA